jgi:hypothetical protein
VIGRTRRAGDSAHCRPGTDGQSTWDALVYQPGSSPALPDEKPGERPAAGTKEEGCHTGTTARFCTLT